MADVPNRRSGVKLFTRWIMDRRTAEKSRCPVCSFRPLEFRLMFGLVTWNVSLLLAEAESVSLGFLSPEDCVDGSKLVDIYPPHIAHAAEELVIVVPPVDDFTVSGNVMVAGHHAALWHAKRGRWCPAYELSSEQSKRCMVPKL